MKAFITRQFTKPAYKKLLAATLIITLFHSVPKSAEYKNPFSFNVGYFATMFVMLTGVTIVGGKSKKDFQLN